MAGTPSPALAERAKRCLEVIRQHGRPLMAAELRTTVGLTEREADQALKYLKRLGLAQFGKFNGERGWKPTKKGAAST